MLDGQAAASAFYLGLQDDVTPKLKKLRRTYARFLSDLLAGNDKVQKSIEKIADAAARSGQGAAASSMLAARRGSAHDHSRFKMMLEPKKGPGLFRRLFGDLTRRVRQQPFVGRLTPMAKGGVVNKPSAILAGEKEAEAIVPLSKLPDLLAEALGKVAQSAAGAAKRPMQTDMAEGVVKAMLDSKKELRAMVLLLERASKSQASAKDTAHKLAGIMSEQYKTAFKTVQQQEVFRQELEKRLIPAMKDMREQTKGVAKRMKGGRGGDDVYKTAALTVILDGLESATENLDKLVGFTLHRESVESAIRNSTLTRAQVGPTLNRLGGTAASQAGMASVPEIMDAMSDALEVGVRDLALAEKLAPVIANLKTLGLSAGEAAQQQYVFSEQMGLGTDGAEVMAAQLARTAQLNNISLAQLNQQVLRSADILQGALKPLSKRQKESFLKDLSSTVAAFADQWSEVDIDRLVEDTMFDASRQQSMAAMMGISGTDLQDMLGQEGGLAKVMQSLNDTIGETYRQQLAAAGGNVALAANATREVISARTGGAIDMSPRQIVQLATSTENFTDKLMQNREALKDDGKALDLFYKKVFDVLGVGGQVLNVISSLTTKQIPLLGTSIASIGGWIEQLKIIPLLGGLVAIVYLLKNLGGAFSWAGKGMGLFGKGTDKAASALGGGGGGGGGLLKVMKDVGKAIVDGTVYLVKGLGTVVKEVSSVVVVIVKDLMTAVTAVGRGLGQAIGGLVAGVLQGLATGLAALGAALPVFAAGLTALTPAIPVILVLGGVAVVALLAFGAAMWMVGKGLGAAAPAFEAIGSAIVGSLSVVMNAFQTMDVGQILATAVALPMLGIGFFAMASGIVAGIGILTAGELLNKVGAFFGLSNGQSIGEAVKNFVAQMADLGPLMQQIGSSGLAGKGEILLPVPVFSSKVDFAQLAEVRQAYLMVSDLTGIAERLANLPAEIKIPGMVPDVDALRRAADEASAVAVNGSDNIVVQLLRRIAEGVDGMADEPSGRGASPSGGVLGTLVRNGVA